MSEDCCTTGCDSPSLASEPTYFQVASGLFRRLFFSFLHIVGKMSLRFSSVFLEPSYEEKYLRPLKYPFKQFLIFISLLKAFLCASYPV